eukprot:TRINITY_DN58113_c0_g1_i1.p1 TRINITY_DN58113_c0_g1~~TRINITY_DN58113_c0_g1_i1.p1  ORF type:complete len:1205 (+),score=191.75 TRINITY_DN58113_c0_g1_i1:102-3716(+)
MPEPTIDRLRADPMQNALNLLEDDLLIAFNKLQARIRSLRQQVIPGEPAAATVDILDRPADDVKERCSATALIIPTVLSNFHKALGSRRVLRESATMRAGILESGRNQQHALKLHPRWQELETRNNELRNMEQLQRGESREPVRKNRMSSLRLVEKIRKSSATKSEELSSTKQTCSTQKTLHPHSNRRLSWDMVGLSLILLDGFLVPVSLAWDVDGSFDDFASAIMMVHMWVSFFFWLSDIVLNFNTGFYDSGKLKLRRRDIAIRYVKSWFLFDFVIVTIDFLSLASQMLQDESSTGSAMFLRTLRTARYLRNLRTLRLLRLVKAGKITAVIEDASFASGMQWIILAFSMAKIGCIIFLVAHILACAWIFVALQGEHPQATWLSLAEAQNLQGIVQYLHAMQWVLSPPSPAPVSPQNGYERAGCCLMIITVVVVIGSALSMFTGTLHELRTINNESAKRRRQVRHYLHTQNTPRDLTARIMRFVDFKLSAQSPVHYDPLLISSVLFSELIVTQRRHLLDPHPIFDLGFCMYPEVCPRLCQALERHYYGKLELVFSAGFLAEGMYITHNGMLTIMEEKKKPFAGDAIEKRKSYTVDETNFTNELRYFTELSLYTSSIVHRQGLRVESFAEVFCLAGSSFCEALNNSPECTSMVCEYAKELLAVHERAMSSDEDIDDMRCAQRAVQANSVYMELNPDPNMDVHRLDLLQRAASVLEEAGRSHGLEDEAVGTDSWPCAAAGRSFVEQVFANSVPRKQKLQLLGEAFIELDAKAGLHNLFVQPQDYQQAQSSCLSLIALVQNDFKAFTEPQAGKSRLKITQWQQLQRILAWTCPSEERLQAVLFLLAIRSLGKCRAVLRQLPDECQRPEKAVLHIIENCQSAVPSVKSLSSQALELVKGALVLHQEFNFAQLLQGENAPANILWLQELITSDPKGEDIFKFYVFFLLGFMSGLDGGHGSKFMTAQNGKSVILGMSMLQHVLNSDAHAIYWTYVLERGHQLDQQVSEVADLAILRLACLLRVRTEEDMFDLRASWDLLTARDRTILMQHFLAGGINESAIVFEFLPLCLERAKSNPHVTVPVLLVLLVALIDKLPIPDDMSLPHGSKVLFVDLSDLAAFLQMVQNRTVVQSCIACAKLKFAHSRVYVQMTAENWSRTHETDSDAAVLAYGIQELLHRQKQFHELIVPPRSFELQTPAQIREEEIYAAIV